MPEQASNLKESATEDLASQIESLLGASEEESNPADTRDQPVAPEAPPTPHDHSAVKGSDLAGEVERMLDDAIERAEDLAAELNSDGDAEAQNPSPSPINPPVDQGSNGLSHSEPALPAAEASPTRPGMTAAEPLPERSPPSSPEQGRAAAAIAGLLSAPLSGRSAAVRDSVGWVAVVTMFMAGCMWAAVLLRDPKPLPSATPAVGLSHGDTAGHAEHASAPPPPHGENASGPSSAEPYTQRTPLITRGATGRKPPAQDKASGSH